LDTWAKAVTNGPNDTSVSLLSFMSMDSMLSNSLSGDANSAATLSPMRMWERARCVLPSCLRTIMKARGLSPLLRHAEMKRPRGDIACATTRSS